MIEMTLQPFNRIKEIRADLGMTQQEFGSRISASQQTISDIENGKVYASVDILKNIGETFDLDLYYIIGVSDEKGSWLADAKKQQWNALIAKLNLEFECASDEEKAHMIHLVEYLLKELPTSGPSAPKK